MDLNKAIIANQSPVIPAGIGTVGIKRFFEAKQNGFSADLVAFIPKVHERWIGSTLCEFERNDLIGKKIYRVVQVQDRMDSSPPCFALTLQEEREPYADNR